MEGWKKKRNLGRNDVIQEERVMEFYAGKTNFHDAATSVGSAPKFVFSLQPLQTFILFLF